MNSTPCPLCNEDNPDRFRIWFDGCIKIYKCLTCGLCFQYPGPGRNTIITDYQEAYSLDFINEGKEFRWPKRRKDFLDVLERITKVQPSGKILDVGCGDGHFLSLLNKGSFELYGVEDCKVLAEYAGSKSGAQVICGLYSKEMFPPESFDIITALQVLEHSPDPVGMLNSIYYHLKKDGIVIIEIPSINSPHFLAYSITGIKKFIDGAVYADHAGYYSPKCLQALAKRCNFYQLSLVTGRWAHRENRILQYIGRLIDPLLDTARMGGILYIGRKI